MSATNIAPSTLAHFGLPVFRSQEIVALWFRPRFPLLFSLALGLSVLTGCSALSESAPSDMREHGEPPEKRQHDGSSDESTQRDASEHRAPTEPPAVTNVVDGDTLDAGPLTLPPATWRIRLNAVDTPELPDEPGAIEATAALQGMVAGRPVRIEHAQEPFALGDFGRLIAYVWFVDEEGTERNANVELVRQGWSRYWTRYGESRYAQAFHEAETEAREASRGVWGMEPRQWPEWPEDVHTVPRDWLKEIPGVGPVTAARIVNYRDSHGPLHSLDDLRNAGIQRATLNLLRDWLTVGE